MVNTAAPALVAWVIAPGMPPAQSAQVVELTRILLLSPLFLLVAWLAGSLAFGHWLSLLIASVVYCVGTIIRIRSEEKLLRQQFGSGYEEYAREVPAFIPLGGTRAVVSQKS